MFASDKYKSFLINIARGGATMAAARCRFLNVKGNPQLSSEGRSSFRVDALFFRWCLPCTAIEKFAVSAVCEVPISHLIH